MISTLGENLLSIGIWFEITQVEKITNSTETQTAFGPDE